MKRAIFYWVITILIYGALLYYFKLYELLSLFYHVALLFPLLLVLVRYETLKRIGMHRGYLKEGAKWVAILAAVLVIGIFLRAFIFQKQVYVTFEFLSLSFFLVAIFGPITEEIFYRGYLQTKAEHKLGKNHGLILASSLFALMHIPKFLFVPGKATYSYLPSFLANPIILVLSCFAIGAVLGMIYRETKSVYYPIACHMLINIALFVLRY